MTALARLKQKLSRGNAVTMDDLDVIRQRQVHSVAVATTLEHGVHDFVIAGGGVFTVTLPTAVGYQGRQFTIKRVDASNTITVDGNGSETIDGGANVALDGNYESVTVVSDGANWLIESFRGLA